MSDFDDRLRDEGRELAARAQVSADTDAAWSALHADPGASRTASPDRSRPKWAWAATAAASLLVVAALASTLFVGGDEDEPEAVATSVSAPSNASTPPTTDPPAPEPESTTAPTLPESGPATTPAPDAADGNDGPIATFTVPLPPGRPCTYTDPARRPINVARAVSCPDGTHVWVEGVVVKVDDRRYLCDHVSGTEGVPCEGATLELIGDVFTSDGGYAGVKDGTELIVDGGFRPVPIPIPTMPSN